MDTLDIPGLVKTVLSNSAIIWPAATARAEWALIYCGFAICPRRMQILMDRCGTPPGNPPHYEFDLEDVIRYAHEAHQQRWWLVDAVAFDPFRTDKERFVVAKQRQRIEQYQQALPQWTEMELLLHFQSETDPQVRFHLGRMLAERIGRLYFDLGVDKMLLDMQDDEGEEWKR